MTLLRQLFNRRNLLSVLTVAIGLASLFDLPQNLGVPQDKIILGLLCFLALESIVVNIGYLEQIQDRVRYVGNPGIDDLITPRHGKFAFKDHICNAQEVLIIGVALQGFIANHTDILKKLAEDRCKLRFVLADPNISFLDSIDHKMTIFPGIGVAKRNIEDSIMRLDELYRNLSKASQSYLELKLYKGVMFYSGMKIATRGNEQNTIWVSSYSYGKSPEQRRGAVLTSNESPLAYQYYAESFENLWKGADSYTFAFSKK